MPEEKKKSAKPELHKKDMPDTIDLPKKSQAAKVWMIVAIVAIIALIGLGIYGYMSMQKLNKQIKDQQAQIDDLSNKKKTLEDAASAAAAAATNAAASAVSSAVSNSNFLEVKELGYKIPLTDSIRDLQYFVNDKTTFFSTRALQSSAWGADSSDAGKYCSLGTLPLGAISKFANASEAGSTQQKALSGFVLGYAPPQANCSNNQATINMQNTQKAALLQAFNNAQKL